MSNWNNEAEAREEILKLVEQYYHDFKEQKKEFVPGDRINYVRAEDIPSSSKKSLQSIWASVL